MNLYGISIPGQPGIVMGFNDHLAWGFTNVGHDVADWYSIKWKDETKQEYWLNEQWVKADIVVEEIKVKGQAAVKDSVAYTHWGPIVYTDEDHPKKDLAFRWLAA